MTKYDIENDELMFAEKEHDFIRQRAFDKSLPGVSSNFLKNEQTMLSCEKEYEYQNNRHNYARN